MKAPEKIFVEVCEDGIFAFPEPPFKESVEYVRADIAQDEIEGIFQQFPLMPQWKWIDPKYEYPPCLTREMDEYGDWHYTISSGKISGTCQYISLAELELLTDKESLHIPETCKENGDSFTDALENKKA